MIAELPAPRRAVLDQVASSRIRQVSLAGEGIPDVIPLWYGEGDDVTPPFIVDAANQALARGETFYNANAGLTELRQAIAGYLSRLHGVTISASRVIVTASGMNGIVLSMQALVGHGDNAVILGPVWPNVRESARIAGGEPRQIDLTPTPDGGFRLDLDRLFAACDDRTRVLFVNSPSNPTGWMAEPAELAAILDFCRQRRIWVMADEVYSRLVYDGEKAPSFLDFARPDDPLVVVNSFSKAWAMTGWRLGWLVLPEALAPTIATLQEFNMSCAPSFVQRAATVAIEQGEDYVAGLRDRLAQARELVMQRMGAFRRVRLARPRAAFYVFPAIDGLTDSLDFAKRLVREAKVGLAPGSAFGPAGEGHLRLCFATSLPKLNQAFDRLAPFLD